MFIEWTLLYTNFDSSRKISLSLSQKVTLLISIYYSFDSLTVLTEHWLPPLSQNQLNLEKKIRFIPVLLAFTSSLESHLERTQTICCRSSFAINE